jgi:hypothetical protein
MEDVVEQYVEEDMGIDPADEPASQYMLPEEDTSL